MGWGDLPCTKSIEFIEKLLLYRFEGLENVKTTSFHKPVVLTASAIFTFL